MQTNVVNTAPGASQNGPSLFYPTAAPSVAPERPLSGAELMRRRYGLVPGSRYGARPPIEAPTPAPTTPGVFAPPVRRGPETILDERPFKVTMYIETVQLLERAKLKAGK